MRAYRTFTVRAPLPEEMAGLEEVALNLRWSWNRSALDLFSRIDDAAWSKAGHDPVRMLAMVPAERWQELTGDDDFRGHLNSVVEDLRAYMAGGPDEFRDLETVAYFSPEFGVSEAIPTYSGGLGVLAGDHLKAASDLGVPLVGVGLLYRNGYFSQHLNADGWQEERYPSLDPHGMPLRLMRTDNGAALEIEVRLMDRRCAAQIWVAQVGRVPLLLLDCDVESNDEGERAVTDRLYGGGTEHRLRQEIVLGVGGVRALRAAGFDPKVWHSNEGHAGFLVLERIRELVAGSGLPFDAAREAVRAATVFTTHTPVPAGIDIYDVDLMKRYFGSFAEESGLDFDDLMDLGVRGDQEVKDETRNFNMAVLGLRLSSGANGVSRLHGRVSRALFASLWDQVSEDEVPILSITNGVHVPTWIGPEIAETYNRRLPHAWAEAGGTDWGFVWDIPDEELWDARCRARARLVDYVRARLRRQMLARGLSMAETTWTDRVFDPGVLTIGFARRFAMYKRGTLLLHDQERLRRLLSSDRPVQIVIAGKAHPDDDGGKEMIRTLVHFARDPGVRRRFAFIEDYDMEVARTLSQGCDLWLNNPRRPLEACGTSGMKAALNGAVNCSILDGWWDECFDGSNGWAIGSTDTFSDPDYQDRVEAEALYDLLEDDVVPRFYDRHEGGTPHAWIQTLKSSVATLGGRVAADRMVRDYAHELYRPAAARGKTLGARRFARARSLAKWKERIRTAWAEVEIVGVEGDDAAVDVGAERSVRVIVAPGSLTREDLVVQLVHGAVGAGGELMEPQVAALELSAEDGDRCIYSGSFVAGRPGLYGFSVRVQPAHPDLASDAEMGLVAWARHEE